ncbi:uncharacterized protein [Onthophagus taurus]|uniref:uncharacterized protein n=1 Tax=Onthophagus taurus TaxID=166361 RepID=UPI0039BE6684
MNKLKNEVSVTIADGKILKGTHKGIIRADYKGKSIKIEVMVVDGLYRNLLSVRSLTKKGFLVSFMENKVKIEKDNFEIFANQLNGAYILNLQIRMSDDMVYTSSVHEDRNLWHKRLGHLNIKGLKLLGLPFSEEKCSICIEGKGTRSRFDKHIKNSKKSWRIHSL